MNSDSHAILARKRIIELWFFPNNKDIASFSPTHVTAREVWCITKYRYCSIN